MGMKKKYFLSSPPNVLTYNLLTIASLRIELRSTWYFEKKSIKMDDSKILRFSLMYTANVSPKESEGNPCVAKRSL